MSLSNALYLAQSKWKAGERKAFATSRAFREGRILPAFKIPPSGSFDPDEQRVLSTTEYLTRFGAQLADACGRRLTLIDAELVDDPVHKAAVAAHPLTELLERARLAGANAAPIYSRSSSSEYLAATKRFIANVSGSVSCLRVSLDELEQMSGASDLIDMVSRVGGRPDSTVLLIDGGPLEILEPDDLVHLLASHIGRVVSRDTWLRVFWSATSLPHQPKILAGSSGRYPRRDWGLFKSIVRHRDEFPVVPMFSDYMLEYPANYRPVQASPTAKLGYSTEEEYLLFKGVSTRYGEKYRNIFPVAKRLVNDPEYLGSGFSSGDAYIEKLAAGSGKTGNASMWKWCSSDHHLMMVDNQVTKLLGIIRPVDEPVFTAEQLQLV